MYVKSWNKQGSWIDVSLTDTEEEQAFSMSTGEHIDLMHKCIETAKEILNLECESYELIDVLTVAKTLFNKEAKHSQYYRDDLARKRFERL